MTSHPDSDDDTLPDLPVVRAAERRTVVVQPSVAAWGASSSLGLRRTSNQDRHLKQGTHSNSAPWTTTCATSSNASEGTRL